MDVIQYFTELPAKISGSYYSTLHKAHAIYFRMITELPKGSMESGMLQLHPFFVMGAWAAYKLNLEKLGDKMINHMVKFTKDGMKKRDESLEGKL